MPSKKKPLWRFRPDKDSLYMRWKKCALFNEWAMRWNIRWNQNEKRAATVRKSENAALSNKRYHSAQEFARNWYSTTCT